LGFKLITLLVLYADVSVIVNAISLLLGSTVLLAGTLRLAGDYLREHVVD